MIVKDMLSGIKDLDFEKVYILGRKATAYKAEALVEQYSLDAAFFDYDDLLASDVDTVYVALPNYLHYSFTKKALLAGKNVIVEKPFFANCEEYSEMRTLAAEKNLFLLEASTVAYFPIMAKLREELHKIGRIRFINANYSQYSSRYDRFLAGEDFPVFDINQAGGALVDLNVYNINFVTCLFGAPKSVTYSANISRNIDTSGVLLMAYDDFKAVCIGAKDCKAPSSTVIQGEKGMISFAQNLNCATAFTLTMNDGSTEYFSIENPHHRLFYEFAAFIKIIAAGDREKADRMLDFSAVTMEVLQEARRQQKLIYPSDKAPASEKSFWGL